MKKRYLVAGAVSGAIGAAIAYKMLSRDNEVVWEDVFEDVIHSEYSHFTKIDGARIHFQEFGDSRNPTLLLIHGFTASTYSWHKVTLALAERGFHVIAVDLLGFGFSGKPKWFDYTITSQARMITRFLNRLGIGKATLVGCSYGGAVAATVALDYPEFVEKLVLVDAVSNDYVKKRTIFRLAGLRGVGEVVSAFLTDSRRFSKARMHETLSKDNHHLITDERVEAIIRPLSAADAHNSVLTTLRNWDANRIEEDAGLINHQTLLIWGEEDTVVPLENGEKLHQSILNSRMVVFRKCGHVPQEEYPEGFVQVVTDFCNDKKGKLEIGGNERMRMEG
jgi:pimeloyl-ACP methyl ester carboxylesterase